jgi:hypothetical protein
MISARLGMLSRLAVAPKSKDAELLEEAAAAAAAEEEEEAEARRFDVMTYQYDAFRTS